MCTRYASQALRIRPVDAMLLSLVLFFVLILLVIILIVLLLRFRRSQDTPDELSTALQNLTQAVQQGQTQIAALTAKTSRLEYIPETVGNVQVELRGLVERISTVEQNQAVVNQGIGNLATGFVQTGATLASKVSDIHQQSAISLQQFNAGLTDELAKVKQESSTSLAELKAIATGLSEATASMRAELARAKNDLTELQANSKARQELELQVASSIKRLEAVIAGTQSKGSAGENILEVVFSKLPVDWQVRNFRVGGKSVEFGLRLPNNLILPIDSKWAATNLLEQFIASTDVDEQRRLKGEIEGAVIQKAKEVKKYIDPSLTVPFGVAVVPDAIYDLCPSAQADAFQLNVVLVSYSMFIPYLLLVFQTTLKSEQSIDLQKLDAYLQTTQEAVAAVQNELDGRFSRALTMLNNTRDDMRAQLSKVGSSLTGLRVSTAPAPPALPGITISAE